MYISLYYIVPKILAGASDNGCSLAKDNFQRFKTSIENIVTVTGEKLRSNEIDVMPEYGEAYNAWSIDATNVDIVSGESDSEVRVEFPKAFSNEIGVSNLDVIVYNPKIKSCWPDPSITVDESESSSTFVSSVTAVFATKEVQNLEDTIDITIPVEINSSDPRMRPKPAFAFFGSNNFNYKNTTNILECVW